MLSPSPAPPRRALMTADAVGNAPHEGVRLGQVHRLGALENDSIQRWMRRAAIYVLPGTHGSPGPSVLDAAAAGCALVLVLGDLDSLRETSDGAAIFVPPDDADALATTINGLIADRSRRDHLATLASGRAHVFTKDRMGAAYIDAYSVIRAAALRSARHVS